LRDHRTGSSFLIPKKEMKLPAVILRTQRGALAGRFGLVAAFLSRAMGAGGKPVCWVRND
jgi:hypothetical protein